MQKQKEKFCLFGFNLPLLNRGQLYLHKLQSNSDTDGDEKLSADHKNE